MKLEQIEQLQAKGVTTIEIIFRDENFGKKGSAGMLLSDVKHVAETHGEDVLELITGQIISEMQ
jgi:hypothetical protein